MNSDTLWCGNKCRDSIPNWKNLIEGNNLFFTL